MHRHEDLAELRTRRPELLRAHCAGDPDAFGELFRRHRDRMWAVALRTVGDREAAADAVQDAFLSALPAGRLVPRRGRGHHLAAPDRRQRLPGPAAPRQAARSDRCPTPSSTRPRRRHDHLRRPRLRLDVAEALDQLPEGQRMALVLVDMHGLPVAEAAAVLGVAEGTVKSRCARGRAAMAVLLGLAGTPPRGGPGPGPKEPSASP